MVHRVAYYLCEGSVDETNINTPEQKSSVFWKLKKENMNLGKFHVRARTIQGYELILDNGKSHCAVADQPTEASTGLGPTPLELCLMSHAGCYATICVMTARKMRLPLKGCDVKIDAVKSQERGTVSDESFDIALKLDAPEDRVQRLHDVTLKTCPVGILFEKAGVKITCNVKTVKE
jgi:putative redox protein